jgi:paraquat-inducible protein A
MIHKKQKSASKSLNRSMLYIVLALIFLVPANLLPIMPIYKYAVYYPNTLLDGVISFYNEGDYFVSGVILISSIILPFVKLFGLTFMIIMVKYNLLLSKRKFFIKYYIAINSISKYSMIDVYVVVLASSYIQYDDLIRIEVGEAFIPFTLVVFFTVLANKNFDTKLLWKEK